MQNAKDTFYEALKSRLAALNPERTISLRGVLRPGILVDENELPRSNPLSDCFHLQWIEMQIDSQAAMPVVMMTCEISYATTGSASAGGLDRGRALEEMDAELASIVSAAPTRVPKMNYSALERGGAALPMMTNVWWGALKQGKTITTANQLARTVTVQVMSLQEAGEL